mmetsp:Transcript_32377/g.102905  ORF Transcript_32377/g.102905 Transcript_32377/m.102905 type:complete len:202 (+) Transcript_32377:226-831(+)
MASSQDTRRSTAAPAAASSTYSICGDAAASAAGSCACSRTRSSVACTMLSAAARCTRKASCSSGGAPAMSTLALRSWKPARFARSASKYCSSPASVMPPGAAVTATNDGSATSVQSRSSKASGSVSGKAPRSLWSSSFASTPVAPAVSTTTATRATSPALSCGTSPAGTSTTSAPRPPWLRNTRILRTASPSARRFSSCSM